MHVEPEKRMQVQNENQDLDPRFIEGIDHFNKREFFESHEILEDLWKGQCEPERQLSQGIIQIAVAYYHALAGNSAGALKLFERGLARVRLFLPEYRGYDICAFAEAVERDFSLLQEGKQNLAIARLEKNEKTKPGQIS